MDNLNTATQQSFSTPSPVMEPLAQTENIPPVSMPTPTGSSKKAGLIAGSLLAVLLVCASVFAVMKVTSKVADQTPISPTAPESEPQAFDGSTTEEEMSTEDEIEITTEVTDESSDSGEMVEFDLADPEEEVVVETVEE